MTLKQLFKFLMKLPGLDCNSAICVLLRGQNQLLSHLGEEMPEKPPKSHRNPSRSRIESIKRAG